MTMEDVEVCLDHYYRFEATKESGKRVATWLVIGSKQDLSELVKVGAVKVKHAGG